MNRQARYINVGDGHLLYVETQGAATALPVIVLHDGPGYGCRGGDRRLLAGLPYRQVCVDQRGAGRSVPAGSIEANTTLDVVADLEAVREALGIPAWVIVGGGWGSLLALIYAQLFTERTRGLVLHGIFLASPEEIASTLAGFSQWLAAVAPDFCDKSGLTAEVGIAAPKSRLIEALSEPSPLAQHLTGYWRDYRRQQVGLPPATVEPDAGQLAQAALQIHYLSHGYFLRPGQLLAGIRHLRHLPAVIVQGSTDPFCPPANAEILHRHWPEATWMPLRNAGHGPADPAIARALRKGVAWVADNEACEVSGS
ncbi:alpha/beta fold hydrolase [Dechloromonas sp.]|uniref:alpha/beta fold hydrolase n=1 Tax=Dechloromonas sp. TaxID=1917218 RepID=UPI00121FC1F9|nr:alpha/beta fold hydrolase [Dechloromonas sp.]MBU3697146.1 alpha/beta fold hydrolase [Dechloromonas sp.]TEX44206.1 MAG: proline iminopeptidase [Rhodocyclaceae bacterium]